MIAHVSGEVVEKFDNTLIIDVGGLGYEVLVSGGDYEAASLNDHVKLYTHDHLRENAHDLFGFTSLAAKKLFLLLTSVSGVGPRMGLSILSLGSAEQVRSAIAGGDIAYVQQAAGVGKRIAERVTNELRDKVGLPAVQVAGAPVQAIAGDDALDALVALGYTLHHATNALSKVDTDLDIQARIKQALKILATA
ncbi:MAG TPA: Holliday junction branch migration protein RuvA [Candidatus Saccharimonadales bacterium]|nr:Holliday junction branch migration protein RuvA [Candidatus Saccharimonadales bacterium]